MNMNRRSFVQGLSAAAGSQVVSAGVGQAVQQAVDPIAAQAHFFIGKLGYRVSKVRNGVAFLTEEGGYGEEATRFVALDGKDDLLSLWFRVKDEQEAGYRVRQMIGNAYCDDDSFSVNPAAEAAARAAFGDKAVDRVQKLMEYRDLQYHRDPRGLQLPAFKEDPWSSYASRDCSLWTAEEMTDERFAEIQSVGEELRLLPEYTREIADAEWEAEEKQRETEESEGCEENYEEFQRHLAGIEQETGLAIRTKFEIVVEEVLGPNFDFVLLRPKFELK